MINVILSELRQAGPKVAALIVLWLIVNQTLEMMAESVWLCFAVYCSAWLGALIIYLVPMDIIFKGHSRIRRVK